MTSLWQLLRPCCCMGPTVSFINMLFQSWSIHSDSSVKFSRVYSHIRMWRFSCVSSMNCSSFIALLNNNYINIIPVCIAWQPTDFVTRNNILTSVINRTLLAHWVYQLHFLCTVLKFKFSVDMIRHLKMIIEDIFNFELCIVESS